MSKLITEQDLIDERIRELRQTGDEAWATVTDEMVFDRQEVIRYNLPQMVASHWLGQDRKEAEHAKRLTLMWSRGTGKTTKLGKHIKDAVYAFPRGQFAFLGPTYRKMLGQIMPSLQRGLEIHGLYRDVHYVVGRKPNPKWNWPTPYHPPASYQRVIYFYNGFILHLISQDVKDDGRGLNLDGVIGDEAGLLKYEEIEANILPGLRGSNVGEFAGHPLFTTELYTTSAPLTLTGEWIYDQERKSRENPDEVGFITADCRANLHNLVPGYLKQARERSQSLWLFEAEYLNIRPKKVESAFYSDLNEDKHGYNALDHYDAESRHYFEAEAMLGYKGDRDVDRSQGLILGVDWGVNINCATVSQVFQHARHKEFRTQKEFAALGKNDENQTDLANMFCDYYEHHPTKQVFFHYDQTGNHKTGMTRRTRAGEFAHVLRERGWKVQMMTHGHVNPSHAQKHLLWGMVLREDSGLRGLPKWRINKDNCPNLLISMTHAPAKKSNKGEIQKDKASERKKGVDEVHATHFSDAMDCPIWQMYHELIRWAGGGGGAYFEK